MVLEWEECTEFLVSDLKSDRQKVANKISGKGEQIWRFNPAKCSVMKSIGDKKMVIVKHEDMEVF